MEGSSEIIDLSESRSPSKRSLEEDLDLQPDGGKRVKMRDLDSVLRFGVMTKCSKLPEVKVSRHQSREDETSQITNTAASLHSDKPAQLITNTSSIGPTNALCLSLGHVDGVESSENLVSNVTHTASHKQPDADNISLGGLNSDVNDNPFHPYKTLGQARSIDALECGSTTGPVEERDPLRMWKEMKQNGFLSSSHGGIPALKQRGHQPKRKKGEEPKKKSDITKREPLNNKFTKVAAPTGLLSGLNPGIIKHVRNSKQVNSIIEAMVQSQISDSQMQNVPVNQLGKSIINRDVHDHNSAGNQFNVRPFLLSGSGYGTHMIGSDIASNFYHGSAAIPQFHSDYYDESLTLKLSSAVGMASQIAASASASDDDLPASRDTIASLSLKGASVASHWLDLLQQDIRGRLAALKRSEKRVRNVIQTELPYLLSKEMSSDQEAEGYFAHASEGGCSKKAILDMHMARWKAIFSQMDKALYEEGKHLENWLKEVQDMQAHCEAGLKYFSMNHALPIAEEFSGLENTEAAERGNAVRAAAASIYSTSNLIMSKNNVPCF